MTLTKPRPTMEGLEVAADVKFALYRYEVLAILDKLGFPIPDPGDGTPQHRWPIPPVWFDDPQHQAAYTTARWCGATAETRVEWQQARQALLDRETEARMIAGLPNKFDDVTVAALDLAASVETAADAVRRLQEELHPMLDGEPLVLGEWLAATVDINGAMTDVIGPVEAITLDGPAITDLWTGEAVELRLGDDYVERCTAEQVAAAKQEQASREPSDG